MMDSRLQHASSGTVGTANAVATDRARVPGQTEDSAEPRRRPLSLVEQFSLLATTLAWACTTMLVITFFAAAVSPANRIMVTVNEYGEMIPEAIVLTVTWTAVSANMLLLWNRARKGD